MIIHPSSTIEDGATIADDVVIGAFCKIGKDTVLKSGVRLEHHVELRGKITVHENTHIFSFAKIGKTDTDIVVGKDCHIREFSMVGSHTDSKDKSSISIGDNCYIMGYIDIRAGVRIENDCIITNSVVLHQNSRCERGVIMGAKSSLDENYTIGAGCMVGGVSKVKDNMPPFCLIEGYPKAQIRGLNIIGMRRNFKDKKSITQVKKAFTTLKKSKFSPTEAKKILPSITDKPTIEFVSFISKYKI